MTWESTESAEMRRFGFCFGLEFRRIRNILRDSDSESGNEVDSRIRQWTKASQIVQSVIFLETLTLNPGNESPTATRVPWFDRALVWFSLWSLNRERNVPRSDSEDEAIYVWCAATNKGDILQKERKLEIYFSDWNFYDTDRGWTSPLFQIVHKILQGQFPQAACFCFLVHTKTSAKWALIWKQNGVKLSTRSKVQCVHCFEIGTP